MPRRTIDKSVPRFRSGMMALPVRQMNAIVDAVNRPVTGVSAPATRQPKGKSGGSPVLILTLVAHNNDYLECQDADLNTVYVAKVYELRRTPFDGETISGVTYTYASASERSATDGVDTETHFITPAYVVGNEIYAIKVQGDTGVNDPTPLPIIYIEMNQGRAWAYEAPP